MCEDVGICRISLPPEGEERQECFNAWKGVIDNDPRQDLGAWES